MATALQLDETQKRSHLIGSDSIGLYEIQLTYVNSATIRNANFEQNASTTARLLHFLDFLFVR